MQSILKKLKVGRLVKITWEDAHGTFNSEYLGELTISVDVGWIVNIKKRSVTITNSKPEKDTKVLQHFTVIPKCCIRKVRRL